MSNLIKYFKREKKNTRHKIGNDKKTLLRYGRDQMI